MNGIFISYASADAAIAMRVYNDLSRSGALVWRYERDGVQGANFVDEARARVRECADFVLIDSPVARRSKYVQDEVRVARESAARFLACLAVAPGPWQSADELFREQGRIRAILLNPYATGIRELCSTVGFEYVPQFLLPQDKDFEDEIFHIALSHAVRQRLIDDYEEFRKRYDESKLAQAARKLGTLIDDCEDRKIIAVSPYLALGVVHGDLRNDRDAADVFRRATEVAPADPRGWAGLGGALYFAGNYTAAAAAYETSDRCIAATENPIHWRQAMTVKVNLAMALTAAGRGRETLGLLLPLEFADDADVRLLTLLGHAHLLNDDPFQARLVLQRAERMLSQSSAMALPTWFDLADTYAALDERGDEEAVLLRALAAYPSNAGVHRRLGAHYAAIDSLDESERYLQAAVRLDPTLIAARAELSLVLKARRRTGDARREAARVIEHEGRTAADHYYLGLARFLLDDDAGATVERRLSRRDAVVGRWPEYDQLLPSAMRDT